MYGFINRHLSISDWINPCSRIPSRSFSNNVCEACLRPYKLLISFRTLFLSSLKLIHLGGSIKTFYLNITVSFSSWKSHDLHPNQDYPQQIGTCVNPKMTEDFSSEIIHIHVLSMHHIRPKHHTKYIWKGVSIISTPIQLLFPDAWYQLIKIYLYGDFDGVLFCLGWNI